MVTALLQWTISLGSICNAHLMGKSAFTSSWITLTSMADHFVYEETPNITPLPRMQKAIICLTLRHHYVADRQI